MTTAEKLRVIAECLRTLQAGEWSVREVLDVARKAGVRVRESEGYRVLYSLNLPGRRAAGKRRHATSRDQYIEESASRASEGREAFREAFQNASEESASRASGSISQTGREAFHANGSNASLDPSGSISGSISLACERASQDPGSQDPLFPNLASLGHQPPSPSETPVVVSTTRPRAKKPEDTAWVPEVVAQTKAIASKSLTTLEADERFTLGRYHALKFGNCTVSEQKNRRMGAKVAAAIASLGRTKAYGEITVREYAAFCRKVHEQRGEAPWFDPWLIKGVVEFAS